VPLLAHLALVLLAQSPERVTLVFGGDVIPHGGVKSVAAAHAAPPSTADAGTNAPAGAGGWEQVLGPLSAYFHRGDLAMVNLEAPLTSRKRPAKGPLVFSAGPSLAVGLREVGVGLASFANNHCLDQWPDGIVSTRELLDKAEIAVVGSGRTEDEAWEPARVQRAGLNVCVLAFTRILNGFRNPAAAGEPHVPLVPYGVDPRAHGISEDELVAKVAAAAPGCDALIVSAHWGKEYASAPKPEDRELALRLIQAGALGIVGHHPHVLQPIETVPRADGTEAFVAYSLGNLVSNQAPGMPDSDRRDGALLEVELLRESEGAKIQVSRIATIPIFTASRSGKGTRRNLQPLILDEEIATVRARLDELSARSDRASRVEARRLGARLESMDRRRARIVAALQPAPPPGPTATVQPGN
jgi:poly-gamma-glutamate synthesis protein (capsule biosynthesis protein)